MAGISAAAGVAGKIGAAKAGQAQADALGAQRQKQSDQIATAAGAKAGERTKAAQAERARLRVAAGEAGVAGQSFEAQLMDSAFQESHDVATISKDTELQQEASQARTDTALVSTMQPSPIASGLQILGGAVGAAYETGGITPTEAKTSVPSTADLSTRTPI